MSDTAVTTPAESAAQQIARDVLRVTTLAVQNSDSLDFHSLAVWDIEAALVAAFNAGAALEKTASRG